MQPNSLQHIVTTGVGVEGHQCVATITNGRGLVRSHRGNRGATMGGQVKDREVKRERVNATPVTPVWSRYETEQVPVGRSYVVGLNWYLRGWFFGAIPAIAWYHSVLPPKNNKRRCTFFTVRVKIKRSEPGPGSTYGY